jgi:hypothetical protein
MNDKFNVIFEAAMNDIVGDAKELFEQEWEFLRDLKERLEKLVTVECINVPFEHVREILPTEEYPCEDWNGLYNKKYGGYDYNSLTDDQLFIYWKTATELLGKFALAKSKDWFRRFGAGNRPEDINVETFAKLAKELKANEFLNLSSAYASLEKMFGKETLEALKTAPESEWTELFNNAPKQIDSEWSVKNILDMLQNNKTLQTVKFVSLDFLKKLYDFVVKYINDNRKKQQDEHAAGREAEIAKAEATEITDEVRKTYFKNYGIMNSWDEQYWLKFHFANALHNKDMKEHPELHEMKNVTRGRGYEETTCKCGFSFSADSSD